MSEDHNPRFEISDGSNRVQLGVGNYVLALNAGDVYETADIAEIEALDKNSHVGRADKEPTRSHEAWDATSGPQPPDYANPAAYVDEAPARKPREKKPAAATEATIEETP